MIFDQWGYAIVNGVLKNKAVRLAVAMLSLSCSPSVLAQVRTPQVFNVRGDLTPSQTSVPVDSTGADATDTTNHALRINCIVGCSGGSGGSTGGTATTANPTYTNNAINQPLSLDLAGNLRTIIRGSVGTILQDVNGRVMVGGVVADGLTPTGNSIHVSGTDAAGLKRTFRTDTTGNLQVGVVGSIAVTGAFYQTTQPVSGTVGISGTVPVSGSFYQATQPVSIASMPTTPVTGTFWQTTQPVSGTITANFGTLNGAATAANQTTMNTTLGSPFQANGSIGNTAFGISGTLPAFAATPTFNLGTISTVATAANQTVVQSALGTSATTALTVQGSATGVAMPVDTVIKAGATDRGTIIGFTGAVISTTSGSNTITLTTIPTSGAVILGQQIVATGVPAGSYIYALGSGTLNAASSTYTLSSSAGSLVASNATATATGIALTSVGPQQLMASNSSRRGLAYQVQSATANVWANLLGTATADYHSLKVASGTYYETPPTHINTGAVSVIADTAATPLFAREW